MKGSIFLVTLATVSLLACGKTDAPVVSPPALETPRQAEPAPVESAPVSAKPVESAPAPVDTPPAAQTQVTPPAPARPTQPAAAKPAPAPVAAPANASPPSPPKPDLAHGQKIYNQACAFCHDKGIAGAPKLGDTAAWATRLAQGIDVLYATALRGKGAMPAKGGNPSLADADVKAAVDFIAAQVR